MTRLAFAAVFLGTGLHAQSGVTPERLRSPHPGEWLTYGRTYDNQRFSPLSQIDTQNVRRLVPTMVLQPGVLRNGGLQTSPVVADGVMYFTTSYNTVVAVDLATKKTLWRHTHQLEQKVVFCCGPNNRGAAIGHGMVYMATLDAHVVALDARTGKVVWNVEDNDASKGYSMTLAALLVDDKVIVGVAGGEYGIRGSVTAYDAKTGKRAWRFYTIPSPEEGGWWGRWAKTTPNGEHLNRDIAAEKSDSAKYADAWQRGGAPVWTTPAYDPESRLLFFGTGNPAPDYDGTVRPGDNLYAVSIVAVDIGTGKLRWYHQYVPHDVWDLDAASPPVLVREGGRTTVVHAGKTGWVYVLDALTGKLVRRSAPIVPQENLFALPTKSGVRRAPGSDGAVGWAPLAYSPRTRYAYVPTRYLPMIFTLEPAQFREGLPYTSGREKDLPDEQWGALTAVDLSTGKIAWQVKTEQPIASGALATAGGLVFMGEDNGWFRAYDAVTGHRLWEFFCGAGVNAPPIAFELDGQQMIAVAAGGTQYGGPRGSAIMVFGLPP